MDQAVNTTRWVSLNDRDFEVVVADFQDSPGEHAVVVRGDGPLDKARTRVLADAGFRPIKGPRVVWARPGGRLDPAEIAAAFPAMRWTEVNAGDTRILFRCASPFVEAPAPGPTPEAGTVPAPAVEQAPPVSASVDRVDTPQPSAGDPEDGLEPADAPAKKDQRKGNKFQAVYHPASKLGQAIALVPINMEKPTATALARIEAEHGPVDGFLADRLGYTEERMGHVLSPEQIDACAMGIAATLRKREMILADQTGLGKGRVLAALMLAAVRAGKKVVFVTEKANLFSDIFRDLMDVEAAELLGSPFLLNSGSRVIDVTSLNGDILFEALPDADLRKVVKSRKLPDRCSFLMCTYSQFNKIGSDKEKFLTDVAKDAYVVVDEAHNAAGADSNTSASLEVGLAGAWGVIRSSATFARNAEALLKYPRVLPPGLRSDDIRATLQAGGNEIAEAVSQYLAEDGVLIRREHDLSEIAIKVLADEERIDRNRDYADALAPILSRLAALQRLVDDEIEVRNEDAQKEGGKAAGDKWYAANFGSRLSPLIRQFMTALSVDFCVNRCIETLVAGEKPVVVIEQTMESLMRELAEGTEETPDSDTDDEKKIEAMQGTQAPTFADALSMMLSRIMHMTVRRGKEDPEKVPVEDQYIKSEAAGIQSLIDRFPALSLSPIDDIRDRIEEKSRLLVAEGLISAPWRADEISARNLRVSEGVYAQMKKVDRNDIIVAFNSGPIDALVITRAASTGLSLHASEKARDQRRRKMIELQIPANVVERVQFWGRVNRRGQVSVPSFETLSTGLPSQMRTLSMENRKVEALSATTSANSRTATSMDVPDIIDSVGNEVAQRILTDRPRLAERMCIATKNIDQETAEQELYYVNKLLQRLCLLSSDEQDELFAELLEGYEDLSEGLKAQGKTPRGTRELAGEWVEIAREKYEDGYEKDGPVFGRQVDLVTMEGYVEKDPISSARINALLAASRARLGQISGRAAGPFFEAQIKGIAKNRRSVLQASLGGRFISVDSALKDKEPNAVKAKSEQLARMTDIVAGLYPGLTITVPDEEGNLRAGVIVDVHAPDDDLVHQPGRWTIRYVAPGDATTTDISIATLLREKKYQVSAARPRDLLEPDLRRFDTGHKGKTQRFFLDGNFVRAMLIATEISAGSMVSYTDGDGERRRSVLIHKRGHKALSDRQARIDTPKAAEDYLLAGRGVFSNYKNRFEGIMIQKIEKGYGITVPDTKEWRKHVDGKLKLLAGTFKADRNKTMVSRVTDANLHAFVDAVFALGVPMYHDNRTVTAKVNPFAVGGPKTPSFGTAPKF
jgi:hypothetical protein